MTRLAVAATLAVLTAPILFHVAAHRRPAPVAPARAGAAARDCLECQRLAEQIDALRSSLAAIQSQVVSQSREPVPPPPGEAARESRPQVDVQEVQAVRAADAERLRGYMTRIHDAFAGERVDGKWAGPAALRVNSILSGDEALRSVAHNVECRQQTCRVELADDGTEALSRRLPFIALNLADMLPSVAAERIEEGDGRSAMVLYMSSRQLPAADAK